MDDGRTWCFTVEIYWPLIRLHRWKKKESQPCFDVTITSNSNFCDLKFIYTKPHLIVTNWRGLIRTWQKSIGFKYFSLVQVSQLAWLLSFFCLYHELHCNPIQGQYRARTGFPGDGNRIFPVRKSTQGKSCFHYRDGFAVCLLIFI